MRLIDADALEELFREVIGGIAKEPEMDGNLEHMVRASAMVIEMIKDAPTIVQERKGRWIQNSKQLAPLNTIWWHECSKCGGHAYNDILSEFCPHCGAHMEGAEDD